jgi:hypothetical protein
MRNKQRFARIGDEAWTNGPTYWKLPSQFTILGCDPERTQIKDVGARHFLGCPICYSGFAYLGATGQLTGQSCVFMAIQVNCPDGGISLKINMRYEHLLRSDGALGYPKDKIVAQNSSVSSGGPSGKRFQTVSAEL